MSPRRVDLESLGARRRGHSYEPEKTDNVPELVTKDYAKDLEALAAEDTKWTKTTDGKEYQSEARQAVCADFG